MVIFIIPAAIAVYQIMGLVKIELSVGFTPTPWIKGTIAVFLMFRSMTLSILISFPTISSPPS